MKSIFITAALVLLVGGITPAESPQEAPQEPQVEEVAQTRVEEEKPVDAPKKAEEPKPKTLTLEEKIAQNVNNCEPTRIRADNAECLPPVQAQEPVASVARSEATPAPVQVTGDKQSWLNASGISSEYWAYVDYIVTKESGWNPNAVNPSSGACGLGQQLPCGKWSGVWNDPIAALQDMNTYVNQRYGGWVGAHKFWIANNWY